MNIYLFPHTGKSKQNSKGKNKKKYENKKNVKRNTNKSNLFVLTKYIIQKNKMKWNTTEMKAEPALAGPCAH